MTETEIVIPASHTAPDALREAAHRVLALARNEGAATGSNGQVFWGLAVRDLEAALASTTPADSRVEKLEAENERLRDALQRVCDPSSGGRLDVIGSETE